MPALDEEVGEGEVATRGRGVLGDGEGLGGKADGCAWRFLVHAWRGVETVRTARGERGVGGVGGDLLALSELELGFLRT